MAQKEKLDRVFSKFIRLRDTNEQGWGQCISCGKIVFWGKAHAGHFINRRHMSLRYSEMNVNLQCVACNTFNEGNAAGYALGLTKKHGEDVIKQLMIAKKQSKKFTQTELKQITEYYKYKVKNLLSGKVFS